MVVSKSVAEGIHSELEEDTFLALGSSNAGSLRRLLFGSVPEKLIEQTEGVSIGVVRCEWPLLARLRARAEHFLDLNIPQLERGDRIELYERLQTGSLWNFDFFLLITLSTAIATLGLLQNSTAVVIGAMLVAPLMTPLLGAGLALVQSNLPLMKRSSRAVVFGFLCAFTVAGLVGILGGDSLTDEMLARGAPNLLGLGSCPLIGICSSSLHRPTRPICSFTRCGNLCRTSATDCNYRSLTCVG